MCGHPAPDRGSEQAQRKGKERVRTEGAPPAPQRVSCRNSTMEHPPQVSPNLQLLLIPEARCSLTSIGGRSMIMM